MVRLPAKSATIALHRLPNGVRLLAIPMPHVQSASVGVFVRVGSRDETPVTNGIGHVLEHMAFKGTTTRSVQAINLDAERLGADVNAYTSKDTTAYFMTVRAPRNYVDGNNERIRALPARYGNVRIIDWATESEQIAAQLCGGADGRTHVSCDPAAARFYANLVLRSVGMAELG